MHKMHQRVFFAGGMHMEPLVILLHGKPCGELISEESGLYRRYRAVCRIEPDTDPMRLFAVGEKGELRLGVIQPENGAFVLHRRMSLKEADAAGKPAPKKRTTAKKAEDKE